MDRLDELEAQSIFIFREAFARMKKPALLWSLGISLPWYAGLVMLVITAIGIMVPAAPGYIGTLNIACTAGLALFGVGKSQSVPFSWFYFFSQWLPITAVGLLYLNREGLSLRSLGEVEGGEPA